MNYYLKSKNGEKISFSTGDWTLYLNLAMLYGWEPQGTMKPKGYGFFKKWNGNYDKVHEGQQVSNKDACNLAMAFETALSDPEFPEKSSELSKGFAKSIKETIEEATGHPYDLDYEISFNINVEYIKEFIVFCKLGAFTIN